MQQFYTAYTSETADTWQDISFRAPVRKAIFISDDADVNLRLPGTKAGVSSLYFRLLKGVPIYLDFQSANCGVGITRVSIRAVDGKQHYVRISVSEYGSTGDNDYFL